MKYKFRIMPGTYARYRLEQKTFLFWHVSSASEDYESLVDLVKDCGGILINPKDRNPDNA